MVSINRNRTGEVRNISLMRVHISCDSFSTVEVCEERHLTASCLWVCRVHTALNIHVENKEMSHFTDRFYSLIAGYQLITNSHKDFISILRQLLVFPHFYFPSKKSFRLVLLQ